MPNVRVKIRKRRSKERTMSRFIDDGIGITITEPITVTYKVKIARMVRYLEPDNGVEFLTNALATVCTDDQLWAFVMELEERLAKK